MRGKSHKAKLGKSEHSPVVTILAIADDLAARNFKL